MVMPQNPINWRVKKPWWQWLFPGTGYPGVEYTYGDYDKTSPIYRINSAVAEADTGLPFGMGDIGWTDYISNQLDYLDSSQRQTWWKYYGGALGKLDDKGNWNSNTPITNEEMRYLSYVATAMRDKYDAQSKQISDAQSQQDLLRVYTTGTNRRIMENYERALEQDRLDRITRNGALEAQSLTNAALGQQQERYNQAIQAQQAQQAKVYNQNIALASNYPAWYQKFLSMNLPRNPSEMTGRPEGGKVIGNTWQPIWSYWMGKPGTEPMIESETPEQSPQEAFASWASTQPAFLQEQRARETSMMQLQPELYPAYKLSAPASSFTSWVNENPDRLATWEKRQALNTLPSQKSIPRWAMGRYYRA